MTPIQEIENHPGTKNGIRLYIKRDDLLCPEIQGNKWRKLKPVIERLAGNQSEKSGILTFGGAFSNHLLAVANAGQRFDFQTVGIVRGMAADFENPILKHCQKQGMRLFKVSKTDFALGFESPAAQSVLEKFPNLLALPEGGAGREAVVSCMEISKEILSQLPENQGFEKLFVAVSAGTGTTAAGIVAGLSGLGKVLVFPAAAYGVSEKNLLQKMESAGQGVFENFEFRFSNRFTKFAPPEPELLAFVADFQRLTGILLDPVYTSKMFHSIWEMLSGGGFFPENSILVAVHTGGTFCEFANSPHGHSNLRL